MTPATQARIREILASVQQSGIAFAFQPHRQEPEFGVERALAEIEKVLKEDTCCS